MQSVNWQWLGTPCRSHWPLSSGESSGVENGAVPLAIWHSILSDRSQREMLKAAVQSATWAPNLLSAKDDIIWLINQAQGLADNRNDGLHSPFVLSIGKDEYSFKPMDHSLNPRAKKFAGKNVLSHIEWYAAKARALSIYSERIFHALCFPQQIPWPNRPRLPHLGQFPIRTESRPRKTAK